MRPALAGAMTGDGTKATRTKPAVLGAARHGTRGGVIGSEEARMQ
jgi:hypothetical protein